MRSQEFRQRAELCEWLARESADIFAKRAMTELAAKFRDEARTLEREEEAGRTSKKEPKSLARPRSGQFFSVLVSWNVLFDAGVLS